MWASVDKGLLCVLRVVGYGLLGVNVGGPGKKHCLLRNGSLGLLSLLLVCWIGCVCFAAGARTLKAWPWHGVLFCALGSWQKRGVSGAAWVLGPASCACPGCCTCFGGQCLEASVWVPPWQAAVRPCVHGSCMPVNPCLIISLLSAPYCMPAIPASLDACQSPPHYLLT